MEKYGRGPQTPPMRTTLLMCCYMSANRKAGVSSHPISKCVFYAAKLDWQAHLGLATSYSNLKPNYFKFPKVCVFGLGCLFFFFFTFYLILLVSLWFPLPLLIFTLSLFLSLYSLCQLGPSFPYESESGGPAVLREHP